CQHSYATPYSF
nr:immunoglobulin light chain junction region [Macaca mulatta]